MMEYSGEVEFPHLIKMALEYVSVTAAWLEM